MVTWAASKDFVMMTCADCGMQIYVDEADESKGGKHAAVHHVPVYFVCIPCSNRYDDITQEVLGESYTPIGDDTKKEPKE